MVGAIHELINQLILHTSHSLLPIFTSLVNDFIQPICMISFVIVAMAAPR